MAGGIRLIDLSFRTRPFEISRTGHGKILLIPGDNTFKRSIIKNIA
jgi:hypothetical protein